MDRLRPIFATGLILVVFTTAALGISGGRVICIGGTGHLAVAGPHTTADSHETCCDHGPADPANAAIDAAADCSDWSLDTQHLERAAGPRSVDQPLHPASDIIALPLAGLRADGFAARSSHHPPAGAAIPRAHLAAMASIILLI